jgi:hypothetical protein
MFIRKLIYNFLTLSLSTLGLLVAGQNSAPWVEGRLERDSIYLGSQTTIAFSIASPDDYLWQWPVLTDKITDKIEIVSQTGIDTVRQRRSDLLLLKKQVTITSFDSGYHAMPPFIFQFKAPGDTIWTSLETEPYLIYVAGLDVDLSLPIRDIKGPLRAPVTFMEVLPWLILALLVAGGILLYRHYLKKKRARLPVIPKPVKPRIPPHTKALDALEQLRQKKLWQGGRIKEYHSEITDILRHYIEGRYNIMAVEMTTTEIIAAAELHQVPSQARNKLQSIFERADLVKFAKSMPLPAEHEESFILAVDFVRSTIPLAAETESKASLQDPVLSKNPEEKK